MNKCILEWIDGWMNEWINETLVYLSRRLSDYWYEKLDSTNKEENKPLFVASIQSFSSFLSHSTARSGFFFFFFRRPRNPRNPDEPIVENNLQADRHTHKYILDRKTDRTREGVNFLKTLEKANSCYREIVSCYCCCGCWWTSSIGAKRCPHPEQPSRSRKEHELHQND